MRAHERPRDGLPSPRIAAGECALLQRVRKPLEQEALGAVPEDGHDFSDVVDTTGLGERLDPETLSYVMRDYFECVKPGFG
jgi:class 3 adenylate cyclase